MRERERERLEEIFKVKVNDGIEQITLISSYQFVVWFGLIIRLYNNYSMYVPMVVIV